MDRFVIFTDGFDPSGRGRWVSIIKAYPEIFEPANERLERVDGKKIKWGSINYRELNMDLDISDLGQETASYVYDISTGTILFNHKGLSDENLTKLFPKLEEFIDSGKSEMKI